MQICYRMQHLRRCRGRAARRRRASDGDGAGARRRVCAPPADDDVVPRARIQRDGRRGARVAVAVAAVVIARDDLGRAARRRDEESKLACRWKGRGWKQSYIVRIDQIMHAHAHNF